MRIGVGFDDTICRTTEIVHDRVEKYALSERLNALDIMNDEFLKEGFFSIYLIYYIIFSSAFLYKISIFFIISDSPRAPMSGRNGL